MLQPPNGCSHKSAASNDATCGFKLLVVTNFFTAANTVVKGVLWGVSAALFRERRGRAVRCKSAQLRQCGQVLHAAPLVAAAVQALQAAPAVGFPLPSLTR